MGKMILIVVVGSILIFGLVNLSLNTKITNSTQQAVDNYNNIQVRNICNSTAQILIAKLGDNPSLRVNSPASMNLMNGSTSYTITDIYMDSDSLIKLNIVGNYNSVQKTVIVYVKKKSVSSGFTPAAVLAAISANNNVQTLGNLVVDGRNHDLNGNVISNTGTLAIWTTNNYSERGNSQIGATVSKVDYAPAKNNNTDFYMENVVYPGGYPNTPDKVLGGTLGGYTEGTLKNIAISGKGGSQYVTNPALLNYPLAGVTYVELPSSEIWNPSNVDGSGILIVHNSSTDAAIKNLNSGTFKGLIIADDMVHVHTTIIGAIVCLTSNPSEGNCIGNGNGTVLYSSAAINQGVATTQTSSSAGYGYENHRMGIKYWYE